MIIKYLDHSAKKFFNDFVAHNAFDGGFLQSWEWGDLQKQDKAGVLRLAVLDTDNTLLATASVLKVKDARFFKKYYIPRGPIIAREVLRDPTRLSEVLQLLFSELKKRAVKDKVIFLRVEPNWWQGAVPMDLLNSLGFIKGERYIQPLHSLVLNLSKPSDAILSEMKQKARYNVRLAMRKGVDVKVYPAKEKLEVFLSLLTNTAKWHKLIILKNDHYQRLANCVSDDFKTYIALATYNGVPVAANLIVRFRQTAYYLMGASERSYKNLMAPYLTHWQTIKFLQEQNCTAYDLWGVKAANASAADPRQLNWEGFSEFKRGLAPQETVVEYYGVWEFIYIKWLYELLSLVR